MINRLGAVWGGCSDATGLDAGLKRGLRLHADPAAWESLQKRGMKHDVSWEKSAARYADIAPSKTAAATLR